MTSSTYLDLPDTKRRRSPMTVLILVVSIFLFASFYLYYSYSDPIYTSGEIKFPSTHLPVHPQLSFNNAIKEEVNQLTRRQVSSIQYSSIAVLLPDWEVLVIISSRSSTISSGEKLLCLYPNNETSPARFSGVLPWTNRATFKCVLPTRNRRRSPFLSPVLIDDNELPIQPRSAEPMLRWSRLTYDSLATETDVVLFVKGVNIRKGINRSPQDLRCVFIDEANGNAVRTAVTSSIQEVFRCDRPDLTGFGYGYGYGGDSEDLNKLIKISLEIQERDKRSSLQLPSVAYYIPWRKVENQKSKSLLCASTMVFNVAKFLREWVMYHSKIGVDKFVIYDNGSDDDLLKVVKELNEEGYDIDTFFWIWPKTQEAGFSHAALSAKDSCTWMVYIDVDEFVFARSTHDHMLKTLLLPSPAAHQQQTGQISIRCNEFGPSNQKSHPPEGVIRGYTCRKRADNRHKSMVLLDAIHHSLDNAIHHFRLKEEYITRMLSLKAAVVNHYKYQAWSEFRAKFRRRVSAYVVDWRQALNPSSQDRTPGLGFKAIEPPGWEHEFCEVEDNGLKLLTQRWFGKLTTTGYKMAWQV